MSLKNRFKKSLFKFFEQEIMEHVDVQPPLLLTEVRCNDMKIEQLSMNIQLQNNMPYERALYDAKRQLFESVCKYITIDESSVIDPHMGPVRTIRCSVYVGVQ